MPKYVFELPHNNPTSGGVYHTINIARKLNAHVRFNQISHRGSRRGSLDMSVGLPDNAFPECDYAITYSDSPLLDALLKLPQVGKVGILMLSYGMAINRERKNVMSHGVTVMTSTFRTQELIMVDRSERLFKSDGSIIHHVGFGFNPEPFYPVPTPKPTECYAALYRHPSKDKKYDLARSIALQLCTEGLIDGYITFGPTVVERDGLEPGCIGHVHNATTDELRELFNACSVFIMPSITEGLNRTPAEATLCGCPSVLCDGAKGELYFPGVNCKWVLKDSYAATLNAARDILSNRYEEEWAEDMLHRVKPYTFTSVAEKIKVAMEVG